MMLNLSLSLPVKTSEKSPSVTNASLGEDSSQCSTNLARKDKGDQSQGSRKSILGFLSYLGRSFRLSKIMELGV